MNKSPFKFLDAYGPEDVDIFFGREMETEDLYGLCLDTRILLIYGYSGTGKTSIVRCGLSNKFRETRWQDILVRKGENIFMSLYEKLNEKLEGINTEKVPWPELSGTSLTSLWETLFAQIELLHQKTYIPVYLIFDQFEELFIYGEKKEQQDFFEFSRAFLDASLNCKMVIIMREEFLGSLWEYEHGVPELKNSKYRIEYMTPEKLEEVISETMKQMERKQRLALQDKQELEKAILEKVVAMGPNIELTYVQVFFDRLYQECSKKSEGAKVVLNPEGLEEMGDIGDVIKVFLKEQLRLFRWQFKLKDDSVGVGFLSKLITHQRTKKAINIDQLEKELKIDPNMLSRYVDFFLNRRIIRYI